METLALTAPQIDRFWKYVHKGADSECWPWTGDSDRWGYGRLRVNNSRKGAHRVALLIATGDNGQGLMALHSCDNAICVNPAHLRYGTHRENMKDMQTRGRAYSDGRKGQDNANARLTEADVHEIRRRLRAGEKGQDIAAAFNVTNSAVSDIKTGRNWRYLPEVAA